MNLVIRATNFIDNTREILAKMEIARERAAKKIGAFVRRNAKKRLNRSGRKGPSRPGEAPRKQTGLLRDHVLFDYDPATRSVVIGPRKFNQVDFDTNNKPVRGTIPEVLEKGGEIRVLEEHVPPWLTEDFKGRWRRVDKRRSDKGWPKRMRRVKIEARPYMLPSMLEEAQNGKLVEQWRNVLTS